MLSILLATLTAFPQMSYWGFLAPITPATTGPIFKPDNETSGNVVLFSGKKGPKKPHFKSLLSLVNIKLRKCDKMLVLKIYAYLFLVVKCHINRSFCKTKNDQRSEIILNSFDTVTILFGFF